jgi:hypothetical protein
MGVKVGSKQGKTGVLNTYMLYVALILGFTLCFDTIETELIPEK